MDDGLGPDAAFPGDAKETAVGDLEQQMKNAYSDLAQILAHYGRCPPPGAV